MSTCNECDIYFYYRNEMGIIEKKQDTGLISEPYYWFAVGPTVKRLNQMSNPYIYAEVGITELDINAYEYANAVDINNSPILEYWQKAAINSIRYPEMAEFKGLKEVVTAKHQCHCDSQDLFRYGCKCGGV